MMKFSGWVTTDCTPTISYYYHDQMETIWEVMDSRGDLVETLEVYPYDILLNKKTVHKDKNLFTGNPRDAETGLDYFIARYKTFTLPWFMFDDPLIIKKKNITSSKSRNLYAYCRNNPITYLDPDGRDILESVSNFVAGFGDTISFGLTSFARNQLQKLHGINAVDTESVSYVTGDSAGMVFDAFAGGKVVGYLLSGIRIGKVAKSLKFTKTAMRRMSDSNRYVPRYILAEAIVTGKRVVDPQDAKNAIKIVSSMFKSGKKYQLNIIYNKVKKIVMHFHYK